MSNSIKRVLHVVTYMGRGGIETMLMNYYRKINREKLQFDFLVHRDFRADYDNEIESLGGRIYRMPRLNPFDPNYIKKLDDFFCEHQEYKVVHSHLDCMAGLPLKYAGKNGVPVRIAHAHNNSQPKDYTYPIKYFFKHNIHKHATDLFACSKEAGEWMFGKHSFHVFPNAINANSFSFSDFDRAKIRNELDLSEDSIVIGHVGRFSTQKNHDYLIDVFKAVHDLNSNSYLILVGSGGLVGKIKEKVKLLNLGNNVIFTGIREDIPELLQAFDVFCFPSLHEGLPVTMIEAQAAGLPCLISDKVPIECAIVDGLVNQMPLTESPEKWARTLLEMANIKRENTYDQICKAGFDIADNAKKLQAFYLDKYNSL